jgi:hypothetical protein
MTTSIAVVATAWAAFQASKWSGRQTFALESSTRQRQLSTEARLEGNQQMSVDVNLFVAWSSAYAGGNEELASFLHDRLPLRIKGPLDAWIATKPRFSKDAPLSPFAMAEYRVEAHERAATLGREADGALARAESANRTSDTYVLHTVLFAMVMMLTSMGVRLHHRKPRQSMLYAGCVVLVVSLASLALHPIAWLD